MCVMCYLYAHFSGKSEMYGTVVATEYLFKKDSSYFITFSYKVEHLNWIFLW